MDSPVDIFKPAAIVLASSDDLIVLPTENHNKFRLETVDGDSETVSVDVGSLIKVVVGSSNVAFLGTRALQLFHTDSSPLHTVDNSHSFIDIVWSNGWYLASKSDEIKTYKFDDKVEHIGDTTANGDYLEFKDGLFYGSKSLYGVTLTEQSVSFGSVTFNSHERILAIAASDDLIALAFDSKIVVLNKEHYEEIPVRNSARAIAFYDDGLYLCHDNGISQVDYGNLSETINAEAADDSAFTGNVSGFVLATQQPAQVQVQGEVISLDQHQQTVADLQAQISQLKSQLELYTNEDQPIVPSTTVDTRFEPANFPASISDAFARLFQGHDLYYYFDLKQKELAEYFAGTDPARAQLLKLTLINDFPSSVLADKLVADLGPMLAPPDVFEAVMKKYHVYEQYKSG